MVRGAMGAAEIHQWMALPGVQNRLPVSDSAAGLAVALAPGDEIILSLVNLLEIQAGGWLAGSGRESGPQQAERGERQLQQALLAFASGNRDEALAVLTRLAAADPRRFEQVRSQPSFAPFQSDVEALATLLTDAARSEAQTYVERAVQLIGITNGNAYGVPGRPLEPLPLPPGTWTAALAPGSNPPQTEQAEVYYQQALRAVTSGNRSETLAALTRLAVADPRRFEQVVDQPAFAPFRAEVESLAACLTEMARFKAQAYVGQAAQANLTSAHNAHGVPAIATENLIQAANRLLEAGGLANCMLASALAQKALEQNGVVTQLGSPTLTVQPAATAALRRKAMADQRPRPLAKDPPAPLPWRQMRQRIQILWRHGPLLLLLLGWLGIGLVGGATAALVRGSRNGEDSFWASTLFDLWAMGFLALVAFGFYMRVRHIFVARNGVPER